ncbi:MAG TPA: gliding motility-associated C-terminal domain-containing protein [Draconibacterium sp.]|nr:gliding motility-associated C-terminal domain-containing protein [Draconibacterium sp.]
MAPNLLKILTFLTFISSLTTQSQEIWQESFSIPEKGVWGSNDALNLKADFEGITTWSLNYQNITLTDSDDYAKTVSTSGGRFECCDINGEIIWYSEEIDISEYKNVKIHLLAQETGSGANEATKFLKAFYKLDNGSDILFEINGQNIGNWGTDTVIQSAINGLKLQIIVRIANFYSADKVILDEVVVTGEEKNPIVIDPGDILINEVLFNPVPGGEDFVEIYNYSEKQIPLNKLYLASRDKNLELTQIYPLTSEKIKLEPGSYLALTKDTNGVFPWFTIECPECFLQMQKFPSFNNDEDYVVLLNNEMEVIDELDYTEKMHLPVFQDREGVSLERISFSASSFEKDNWHSASALSGFGTPGYKNSQSAKELPEKVTVHFEPEAFSPNSDGYNDFYQIRIQTDHPGYLCTIRIFDTSGNMVYILAQNALLGTTEEINWNGKEESGRRLSLGVYIVSVELYDLKGNVKHFKDGVVLTDVLE